MISSLKFLTKRLLIWWFSCLIDMEIFLNTTPKKLYFSYHNHELIGMMIKNLQMTLKYAEYKNHLDDLSNFN